MELHTAVKKMMLSIKLEGNFPEECYPELREYLKQMYVVGYDHRGLEWYRHNSKAIGQYNREGKLINTFTSRVEAARKTGFPVKSIQSSMDRGTAMRQGWTWKYLPMMIPLVESRPTLP
jgi:hypothetical protein